jgi:hypothetical protein
MTFVIDVGVLERKRIVNNSSKLGIGMLSCNWRNIFFYCLYILLFIYLFSSVLSISSNEWVL